jgi:hypothetical protein
MTPLTACLGIGVFQVLSFLTLALLHILGRLSRVHNERLKQVGLGGVFLGGPFHLLWLPRRNMS